MERNVWKIDGILRLSIATIITVLIAADVITGYTPIILGTIVSMMLITTWVLWFCPPYALFWLSTCPLKKSNHKSVSKTKKKKQ